MIRRIIAIDGYYARLVHRFFYSNTISSNLRASDCPGPSTKVARSLYTEEKYSRAADYADAQRLFSVGRLECRQLPGAKRIEKCIALFSAG